MADKFANDLRRILELFQQTWAERDAFRTMHGIAAAGDSVEWDAVLQAARIRAQALFQPALSDLENGVQRSLVLEELRGRLETRNTIDSR